MYRIAVLIIFVAGVLTVTSVAQERRDFFYYDSLTYKEYNDGRWRELTSDARKAIALGHDFYYMRMRLGISLYERGNYLLAVTQFRKALEFNHGDPIALEYIYYCYLNTGKVLTANAVAEDFSLSLRKKTAIDEKPKNRVSIDYLYNNAISEELVANYTGIDGYGLAGNLVIPSYYSNAGLNFSSKTGDRTSVSYALTFLRKSSLLSYNDATYSYDLYEQKLNQLQLYFSFNYSSPRGFTVTPAVHYLNTGYPLISISGSGMSPRAFTYKVTEHNIVTSVTLSKSASIIDLVLEGGWSYLNYYNHLQAKGALYLRPAGNSNLYFGGGIAFKSDEISEGWSAGIVSSALAGIGIANRVWIDLSALYGDIRNYSDRSGYLVYNGINEIDYILKADISIAVGKSGAWLYLGTRYGSEYTAFIPDGSAIPSGEKNNYKSISIIGGISWTF